MAKQVYKYNLKMGIPNTDRYANDAKVVLFGVQEGRYYMWLEVDQQDALERERLPERTFVIVATGGEIPSSWVHHHSFQEGPFVWHLYEVV